MGEPEDQPRPDDLARIERVWGDRCVRAQRVHGGYTPAERWRLTGPDGASVFAKVGNTEGVSRCLRDEALVYQSVRGAFLPDLFGFDDAGERPVLVIEDLSRAHWPPPWGDGAVELVLEALDALASVEPAGYEPPPFAQRHPNALNGWEVVASSPEPFLGLGWVAPEWLDHALPALIEAERSLDVSPRDLGHYDVRSDNLCLTDGRAVLVDWNLACRGQRRMDVGFWLPSLEGEGGPPPESVLPEAPDVAAWVSGFFAARAGLPVIPHAPRVRHVQQTQLQRALPWVQRALALPPIVEAS